MTFEGIEYLVVVKSELAGLYGITEQAVAVALTPAPAPKPRRQAVRRPKAEPKPTRIVQPAAVAEPEAQPEAEPKGRPVLSVRDRVLGLLAKRPMSSQELGTVLQPQGVGMQSLYSALTYMRSRGDIVMINDAKDGVRRNALNDG